jgi:hypothetical protein
MSCIQKESVARQPRRPAEAATALAGPPELFRNADADYHETTRVNRVHPFGLDGEIIEGDSAHDRRRGCAAF